MPVNTFPRTFRACPIDALPDLLYNAAYYVRSVEDDIPAEALLTDAIAAASVAVQLDHDVKGLDARVMPTSINTLAAIPSGAGKGTSFSFLFQAFDSIEKKQLIQSIKAGAETTPVGLLLQDASYRALVEHLAGINRSTTIQHEDGWSFLQSDLISRYIDKLTQIWSGKPLKHKVHKVVLTAVEARCSLGFRIQPDVFYPFLKRTKNASFSQGLWPRAIAACYDPKRFMTPKTFMPAPLSSRGLEGFSARLQELLADAEDHTKVELSDRKKVELDKDAAAFMYELKFRMKQWIDSEYADIHEAADRAWENTLRLAAVFHVVCVGAGAIALEMVERAWTIVEWSLTQHRLIFVRANQPDLKQKIALAAKLSKPPKHPKRPRPIEDAQWFLHCLETVCSERYTNEALLSDVERRAGLHGKRLETAIDWLKYEQVVETARVGEHTVIRLTPSLGRSWPRPSTGSL